MIRINSYKIIIGFIGLMLLFTVPAKVLGKNIKPYNDNPDSLSLFIISKISIVGNKISQSKIVLKELTFQEGDTINQTELPVVLAKSKENLLKTPLFNYVTIDVTYIDDIFIEIVIIVEERWYTWPRLSIRYADRNFSSWLKNKDLSRVNYGVGVERYNFRGLNERIRFNTVYGYNEIFTLYYNGFFLDRKQNHSVGAFVSYERQHQIAYQTIENQLINFKHENNYAIESYQGSILYTFRPNLYDRHLIYLSYFKNSIDDTIATLNPDFFGYNKTKIKYFIFDYNFRIDRRNSRSYPTLGYYFTFQARRIGFPLLFNDDVGFSYITVSFKKFMHITEKLYGATEVTMKKSTNEYQPYYLQQGLGYKDFIAGYEYYVVDGQDYYVLKGLLKYELLPQQIIYLKFLPLKKFNKIHYALYLNAFVENGYVTDKTEKHILNRNSLANSYLPGFGIGMDLVTYYDKIVRVEYSVNKFKKGGFFVHFFSQI